MDLGEVNAEGSGNRGIRGRAIDHGPGTEAREGKQKFRKQKAEMFLSWAPPGDGGAMPLWR